MFRIPVIISFSAILFFVLVSCSQQPEFPGSFGYLPSTPSPEEEITINYNPDSTTLSGLDEVKCIAYLYSNELNNTVDVPLNKDGNTLTGKLTTEENTLGVILKFKSGDVVDNNDKSGYVIFLTGNDGERLPGSLAGLAAAHNKWGAYYIDLERDRDKAYNFFEEEFKVNPQVKEEFLQSYFETVNAVRVEDSEAIINADLEALEKKDELSEENYELLADWYSESNNLEEAVKLTKSEDSSITELYSKMLVENGVYGKAMDEISAFIETGHGTAIMKDLLREAYLNEKGSDEGFGEYAARFEDAAKEKLKIKLEKEMILEPAPAFALNNLDGNIISLADYKGKTVIVDFWATWCGPCRASFPGMKKSLEKYSDDENVKFFFVNSWERVEDKHKIAADFISKNEYPFRVLMDEENKVIEMFKVSGIPTKFIIDGEGNIRFKSVGFPGTDEQLVEELDMMISMLN